MTYDILGGRDQEYFEFLVREFAPGLTRLGLQPIENWYTQFGEHPQILMGSLAEDVPTVQKVLSSPEWQALHEKLSEYVTNYKHKLVRMSAFFPLV
jgi:hypothetical protein